MLVFSFESGSAGCVSLPALVGRDVLISPWRGRNPDSVGLFKVLSYSVFVRTLALPGLFRGR